MPHVPKGRTIARLSIPLGDGRKVLRSTGTRDKRLIRAMAQMVDELGPRGAQAWDVLGALVDGTWDIPTLYAAWMASGRNLVQLRARVNDLPLAPLVEPWLASIARDTAPDTRAHYRVYLDALLAAGIAKRSDLTVPRLAAWVSDLPWAAGTVRKYAAGVQGFCSWLVLHGHLPHNPMADVPKPSPAAPRDRWLETADAMRLADAQPEPFRTFSAVLAATGLDVSAALTLRKRDVDTARWTITRVRPKTGTPHVVVVATWGREYLSRHLRTLHPSAKLFPFDRWQAGDQHTAGCHAAGIPDYWMRDARHTWAVRWAKSGGSAAQGAEQLGHTDGGVLFLKVYGSHYPPLSDRLKGEDAAALRDVG